jgi:hypothetical protein
MLQQLVGNPSLASLALAISLFIAPQGVSANTITAQFSGTISTTGAPTYETDNIGFFGGGSLAGDQVTITYEFNTDSFSPYNAAFDQYTQGYQDMSNPANQDGTVSVSIAGYTLQSPVFDMAEILESQLHYNFGIDAFALEVPGGYNVQNGLEVQVFSVVASYNLDFIPNYLTPDPPGFSLSGPFAVAFDPNEIYLINGPTGSPSDSLYYDVTSVTVSGDADTTPEPSSLILTISGVIIGLGSCRRMRLVKRG